jgi:hypothetical protein
MKTLLALLLSTAAGWAQGLTYERIRNPAQEPANWLTYSGNYAGAWHSPSRKSTTPTSANSE